MAAGAFLQGPFAYLNRRPTINPTGRETQTPIDPSAGRLAIRILVDLTSPIRPARPFRRPGLSVRRRA